METLMDRFSRRIIGWSLAMDMNEGLVIETLKGSRQLWLYNVDNLSKRQRTEFNELYEQDLKTSRAGCSKKIPVAFEATATKPMRSRS